MISAKEARERTNSIAEEAKFNKYIEECCLPFVEKELNEKIALGHNSIRIDISKIPLSKYTKDSVHKKIISKLKELSYSDINIELIIYEPPGIKTRTFSVKDDFMYFLTFSW